MVNQSKFSYIVNINLTTKIEVKLSKSIHYCTLKKDSPKKYKVHLNFTKRKIFHTIMK